MSSRIDLQPWQEIALGLETVDCTSCWIARASRANHKLVYRLYQLAGLKLRGKRGQRRCGESRGKPLPPIAINDGWSMDVASDRLVDGRPFRAFAVVDEVSKRCVVIKVNTSLPGLRVIRALEQAIDC
jgi:putative transposase